MGWPVSQKSVRVRSGSVPATRPSDHGISMKSIEAASPSEARVHIAIVTSDMNAASGVRAPGCRARQSRWLSARRRVMSHVPTTTRVRPT